MTEDNDKSSKLEAKQGCLMRLWERFCRRMDDGAKRRQQQDLPRVLNKRQQHVAGLIYGEQKNEDEDFSSDPSVE